MGDGHSHHVNGHGHAHGHHHDSLGDIRFAFFLNLGFAIAEIAGGLWTNKAFVSARVTTHGVSEDELNVLCDPQTSGGLLITLDGKKADRMLKRLWKAGVTHARLVGTVLDKGKGSIIVKR